MKAHVEPKSKECPFCGASTYEVMSGTGVKCIRCTNKRTCGAIVSFSNKDCNERGVPRLSTSIGVRKGSKK